MSMDLARKTFSCEPEYFIAGTNIRIATAVKEAGADLVFLPIYYTPASMILMQANAMGYAPTFFGCDGMDGILAI